jgi:hypothetical protein
MTETGQPLDAMGPIDWVMIEWTGAQPDGATIAPYIIDLVDRGIARVMDIAFIAKDADGTVTAMDLETLDEDAPLGQFAGASSGLLAHEDVVDAGEALAPGSSAAVIVWENRWVLPLAGALRRSGGELVARGRIELDDLVAALDATEAVH